jgi:hypothetical protein
MCCPGGCIKGNGTLINKPNTDKFINAYAASAAKQKIL